MLGSLLLSLMQATTPSPVPNDIIVIGRKAEKDLAACLERHCPPAEEVETSLQASVEQFADGRYDDSRRTLTRAIARNRRHAAALPGPVSSLYATLATVAEHQGDKHLWKTAARNNVTVLRQHLGQEHNATLLQELYFGDNMVGLGLRGPASDLYLKVQRKALARGQTELAVSAAIRRAWTALLYEQDKDAERFATEAVMLAGERNGAASEVRDIIRARIAMRRGDEGAIDALAARLRQSAVETPRLLFAPPIEEIGYNRSNVKMDAWHSQILFVDIGYWIRPDGRTAGTEVLRASPPGQWMSVIVRQIGKRRYTPLDVEPDKLGSYRIERFTVRGTIDTPIGSRIPRRMGRLDIRAVDLTETDAMSAASRERTAKMQSSPTG